MAVQTAARKIENGWTTAQVTVKVVKSLYGPPTATVPTDSHTLHLLVSQLQRSINETTNLVDLDKLLVELAPLQESLLVAEQGLARQSQDTIISAERNRAGGSLLRKLQTTSLGVMVELRMSYVPVAIYPLLNGADHPLLTYRLKNDQSRTIQVRITSLIDGYSQKASDEFEIKGRAELHLSQLPTLLAQEALRITIPTQAALSISVEDMATSRVLFYTTEQIRLLPHDAIPLEVKDPTTGEIVDLSRYLGAFVTPNAPIIMQFLRNAAKHHPAGQLYGYQQDVLSQVKAIFATLKEDSGIIYINSPINFDPDENAKLQRVRLPRESLEERAANCIDGALLFASLLEAASLNPALVIIPGHVFVGWQNQTDRDDWRYLETTMIGTNTFEEAVDIGARKAKAFSTLVVKDPSAFRRWSVRELRTTYQIMPVE